MQKYILTMDPQISRFYSQYYPVIDDISKLPSNRAIITMISYGKLIPDNLLEKHYFLNIHNSLLPKYKGMHAFSWAIINGEELLGYTFHIANHEIDGGPIIAQHEFKLDENETVNDAFEKGKDILTYWLYNKLKNLTIQDILNAKPQTPNNLPIYQRRTDADSAFCWKDKTLNIHNLIRATAPPYTEGAYCMITGQRIRFKRSRVGTKCYSHLEPGAIITSMGGECLIKTEDSTIWVTPSNKDDLDLLNECIKPT